MAVRWERLEFTTAELMAALKDQPTAARPERRASTTVGLTAEPKGQPTAAPLVHLVSMTAELTAAPERYRSQWQPHHAAVARELIATL